jgi:hypothetical protein
MIAERKTSMNFKVTLTALLTLSLMVVSSPSQQTGEQITVYKDRSCSCCKKWIAHLQANGFKVEVHEVDATAPYQKQYHVPDNLVSCHTAVVSGYTLEGHVPAREIQKLLAERPKIQGLAVPGMPVGSPGMEGPRSQAYSVVAFNDDGQTSIYANYPAH